MQRTTVGVRRLPGGSFVTPEQWLAALSRARIGEIEGAVARALVARMDHDCTAELSHAELAALSGIGADSARNAIRRLRGRRVLAAVAGSGRASTHFRALLPLTLSQMALPIDNVRPVGNARRSVEGPVEIGAETKRSQGGTTPGYYHPGTTLDSPEHDNALELKSLSTTNSLATLGSSGGARAKTIAPISTAQTLLAEHIDAHGRRPPSKVCDRMGRAIRELLAEAWPPDAIREALRRMRSKAISSPAALPGFVNEVANAPTPEPASFPALRQVARERGVL